MGANINTKQDIVGELRSIYSKSSIRENCSSRDYYEYVVVPIIEKRDEIIDLLKTAKISKESFKSLPNLWWEGSDAWNDLYDESSDGIFEYLRELEDWIYKADESRKGTSNFNFPDFWGVKKKR